MQFDPDDELFFDTASIDSGEDFPPRLIDEIACAAVVLVLIGPGWLDEIHRRARLDEVDFVRREVEQALQRRTQGQALRVIPVLMGGAAMPSVAALAEPVLEGMTGLCALDAHVFQHSGKQDDWEHQFVRLRSLICDVHEAPRERYRDRSGRLKPWKVVDHTLSAHFQDPCGRLSVLRERLQGGGTAAVLGSGGAKAAALHGMGGIGKTQLALAYCHQYRDAYAGIWWLRAESEGGLGDTLLQQDALLACAEAGVAVPERMQGDLAGAHHLEERMVTVRSRTLGETDPDTLRSMINLAETRRSKGDLAGARVLQEQVLAVRIRVLGEEDPGTSQRTACRRHASSPASCRTAGSCVSSAGSAACTVSHTTSRLMSK
jgi:hypothetical protein